MGSAIFIKLDPYTIRTKFNMIFISLNFQNQFLC